MIECSIKQGMVCLWKTDTMKCERERRVWKHFSKGLKIIGPKNAIVKQNYIPLAAKLVLSINTFINIFV